MTTIAKLDILLGLADKPVTAFATTQPVLLRETDDGALWESHDDGATWQLYKPQSVDGATLAKIRQAIYEALA